MQFSMYNALAFAYAQCSHTDNRITKDKLVNSDLIHTANNSVKSV